MDKCTSKLRTNHFQNSLISLEKFEKKSQRSKTEQKNSSIHSPKQLETKWLKMWLTNRQFHKMDIWIKLFVCTIILCGLLTGTEGE